MAARQLRGCLLLAGSISAGFNASPCGAVCRRDPFTHVSHEKIHVNRSGTQIIFF